MRPRRGKNNQTVPLYEECALWDSLLNAPFLRRISWESSPQRQGAVVLQAFNTSTFPEFTAGLVCRSWGREEVGLLLEVMGGGG